MRKRAYGGHTAASWDRNVDIVRSTFRHTRAFLPALRAGWRTLRFRLGRTLLNEARVPRRRPRHWRATLVDPAPFRFGRFSDGTRMEILGGY